MQYVDTLNAEGGSDPSLQRELATAFEKVGGIQGNPYSANLGGTEGALASYRKATALRERLSERDATPQTTLELARSYRGVGDIMALKGNMPECLENYRHSLALIRQLAASNPADADVQDELARAYETLGDGLSRTDENTERLRTYKESLAIRSQLLASAPDDRKNQRRAASAFMKVAVAPGVDKEEAVEKITHALAMLEALAAADPQNGRARREVGFAYYQYGMILTHAGDRGAALPVRQKALEIRAAVSANDPKNQQAGLDLAVAHGDMAETFTQLKQPAEALAHARECLEMMRELAGSDRNNAVYTRNVGLAYERLADAFESLGADEAQPLAQRKGNLEQARLAYAEGLGVFTGLRDHGALIPNDTGQIAKFSEKFAAMDAELE